LTTNLPAELKAALDRKIEGLARARIAERAAAISQAYRSGRNSLVIRTELDALAYALVRMPATYAAVAASLKALQVQRPDFTPQSLLDLGAGPGTAGWAAAQAFDTLSGFHAVDSNDALRSLAVDLFSDSPRLLSLRYEPGEIPGALHDAPQSDLVIASYVINELNEHNRAVLAERMWEKARHILLVIEPGTPAGYANILSLREQLIATGAHVIAPCPHNHACPLAAPDWCHFSQRLSRSRAHKDLKGADAPFEDERFIYLALARTATANVFSRVLAQPATSKVAVTAKLCTPRGLQAASVPRRNKLGFAAARRWDWGDAVPFDA